MHNYGNRKAYLAVFFCSVFSELPLRRMFLPSAPRIPPWKQKLCQTMTHKPKRWAQKCAHVLAGPLSHLSFQVLLKCSHRVSLFGQLLLGGFEQLLQLGGRLAQIFGQLLLLLQALLFQQQENTLLQKHQAKRFNWKLISYELQANYIH